MRRYALLFILVAAACGKKSDAPGAGKIASCNSPSMHACVEYHDANLALGSDSLVKLCTVIDKDAVFAMTACPTGAIGTCQRNEGKDFFYAGYPLADQIEKYCTG